LIEKCLDDLRLVHLGEFDSSKADRTAAMFLEAVIRLSTILYDVELRSKESKHDVERVEAETYKKQKTLSTAKMTETMLTHTVAADPDVVAAKKACAEAEATAKKWSVQINSLNNGHVFFRNLGKNKNTW